MNLALESQKRLSTMRARDEALAILLCKSNEGVDIGLPESSKTLIAQSGPYSLLRLDFYHSLRHEVPHSIPGFVRAFENVFIAEDVYKDSRSVGPIRFLFSHLARDYESIVNQARNIAVYDTLLETVFRRTVSRPPSVIDFGCGSGLVTCARLYPDVRVTGVDACPEMRSIAKSRGLVVMEPEKLATLPEDSFDGIVASYVLHFPVPPSSLASVWRQLKSGGYFVGNFHKRCNEAEVREAFAAMGAKEEVLITDSVGMGSVLAFQKFSSTANAC